MLFLEQESYLSYIKKTIKNTLQTTDAYTAILKNQLQKALDTIIGGNQSAAIKKVSSVISLDFLKAFDRVDWDFVFSTLQKFGYGDKLIHMIKLQLPTSNLKLK